MPTEPIPHRSPPGGVFSRLHWLPRPGPRMVVCAALATLVGASRAWLAHAWGSALPFWDEWDVEALALYRPWLEGTLHISDLVKAHNEHHLLLTRLVDLVFFVAYGRWEPWSQIILNGVLHAATAAALAALFWPALSARARVGFVVGLATLFTATSGWQNALLGIQSQVYFSSLFGVAALAGLTLSRPWSRGWWLGWIVALSALFCFAAGVLSAMAALFVCLVFPPAGPRPTRSWGANGLLAVVIAMGLMMFVEPPGQVPLHAHGFAQFYATFSRCLSWPHVDSPVMWVLLQFPLLALLIRHWRGRMPLEPLDRFALALAAFALLQAAAVAHNRAGGLLEGRPLSRYQDPLLLGVAAQWFAALRLASHGNRGGRVLALMWAGATAIGLLTLTTTNLSLNLPYKRAQDTASITQVRTYLASHDASVFSQDPLYPGPHPNPQIVQSVLDDPLLRPVLPAIFFSTAPEATAGLHPWVIVHGRTLTFCALVAFGGVLVWSLRRRIP